MRGEEYPYHGNTQCDTVYLDYMDDVGMGGEFEKREDIEELCDVILS